ncbi:hypothetical protein rosag_33390 [Roseisolibacter agri]|uniref:Uncharacterized protein n=2 Tax=Roseisolibacter agri TaxID=2014610 RepID=A0AA37QDC5_9BACT|nr:hypothetical protein rosag_33390 [Roseisolibacter agri]
MLLGEAHPLHSSVAQLTWDPATRVIQVGVRVFADDFASVVTRGVPASGGAVVVPPDSAMQRYVGARFALADRTGRPIALRWCGARREGDVLLLCLRAAASASPAGGRVRHALLTEVFSDQVNVVQASYDGRRETVLFTPGDGAKPLR